MLSAWSISTSPVILYTASFRSLNNRINTFCTLRILIKISGTESPYTIQSCALSGDQMLNELRNRIRKNPEDQKEIANAIIRLGKPKRDRDFIFL